MMYALLQVNIRELPWFAALEAQFADSPKAEGANSRSDANHARLAAHQLVTMSIKYFGGTQCISEGGMRVAAPLLAKRLPN